MATENFLTFYISVGAVREPPLQLFLKSEGKKVVREIQIIKEKNGQAARPISTS
jgi:hypothetical protein